MLIPTHGQLLIAPIGRLDPVPPAVPVPPEPPGLVRGRLVGQTAPEDHDHPGGTADRAEGPGVVDARGRFRGASVYLKRGGWGRWGELRMGNGDLERKWELGLDREFILEFGIWNLRFKGMEIITLCH